MKASRVILLVVCLLAVLAVPITARLVTAAKPSNLGPAVHITPVARTTAPPTAPPTGPPTGLETEGSNPTTAPPPKVPPPKVPPPKVPPSTTTPPKATQTPAGAQQVRPKVPFAGDDDDLDDDTDDDGGDSDDDD